ncbi:MAG: HNH endonuclease [Clostridium sp.]|nr:HNH endonuclease [Clostridium sp.]
MMATIALYAGEMNQMPGFINGIKRNITDFQAELSAMRTKTQQINPSICNLSDVISSIQASSQIQEQKMHSLDVLSQNMEQFADTAAGIDANAADVIRQNKDDFYDKYYYLKPECEKNIWEKICNGCKKAGEWCKEHWVMLTTIIVVIAIAVIAVVTFGIAVAAVAAIAGIIALVLCIADTICMIATGGMDLSAVFRANGWNALADIFQGLQIGCDIVSIVFPAGAAIKTMSKIGVKNFAKASIHAFKAAFKETVEALGKEGFKKSFKDGVKNLGKIAFKTFVFDIDDLTTVKKGKRVWNLKESTPYMAKPNKNWIVDGNRLIPRTDIVPRGYNPKELTMAEIMGQEKFSQFPDTIPFKNQYPDQSGFAIADVDINMKKFDISRYVNGDDTVKKFKSDLRTVNFDHADEELLKKIGKTKVDLENSLGFKLTWHEDFNMKKCYLVPTEIHNNLGHTGGVANFKFHVNKAPDISLLLTGKSTQFTFRFGTGSAVSAVIGD